MESAFVGSSRQRKFSEEERRRRAAKVRLSLSRRKGTILERVITKEEQDNSELLWNRFYHVSIPQLDLIEWQF